MNVFVLATGYIMCRHEFKYIRIFRLWRIVAGYSLGVVLTVWLLASSVDLSWRDWASAVLPVTFDSYWFFTKYVALFLTIPFLNKMLYALSSKEQIVLLLTGFGILSFSPVLTGKDLFGSSWGYSYIWFLYLYLFGACLAIREVKNKIKDRYKILFLFVGCLLATSADPLAATLTKMIGGGGRFGELAWSYTSPLMLIEAAALLLIFASLEVKNEVLQHTIKLAAPGTFVVYIVHMNRAFRQAVDWNHSFLELAQHGECVAVLGTIVVSVCLFGCIVFFDCMRLLLVRFVSGLIKH